MHGNRGEKDGWDAGFARCAIEDIEVGTAVVERISWSVENFTKVSGDEVTGGEVWWAPASTCYSAVEPPKGTIGTGVLSRLIGGIDITALAANLDGTSGTRGRRWGGCWSWRWCRCWSGSRSGVVVGWWRRRGSSWGSRGCRATIAVTENVEVGIRGIIETRATSEASLFPVDTPSNVGVVGWDERCCGLGSEEHEWEERKCWQMHDLFV